MKFEIIAEKQTKRGITKIGYNRHKAPCYQDWMSDWYPAEIYPEFFDDNGNQWRYNMLKSTWDRK